MKKYYQTLNKEKKAEIKKIYQDKYKGSELTSRLNKLTIYIVLAIIAAIVLVVLSLLYEDSHISSFIIAALLVITAIIFMVGKYLIKSNLLNKIALENKKRS